MARGPRGPDGRPGVSGQAACHGCSGERCAEHAESRRLVKATPVEVVATWGDHESKFTVPLWMLHVFTKMARELDAQTPGVLYTPNHRAHRFKSEAATRLEFKGGSKAFGEFFQESDRKPDADST